ncbi:hypothetical protein RF11_09405 [Thelohanellus kitauei]|uniref:CCHC-type domain-containing protein n=1 Tax=Thelohanellus kitauei TaxID=669202 RepID=A0A0C2MLH9_THEKT|nr:hypothetical protein RF11_09405 [Thelohanellus kitauei]
MEPSRELEVPHRDKDIEKVRSDFEEFKTVYGLCNKVRYECTKCGLRGHRLEECRDTVICYICNTRGHISKICPRNKQPNRNYNYVNKSSRRYFFVSGVSSTLNFNLPLCLVDLNKIVFRLIDTGASVSLIHSDYVDPRLIKKANTDIAGVDGSSLNNIREVDLRIRLGDLTTMWRYISVKKLIFEAIIGRDTMLC